MCSYIFAVITKYVKLITCRNELFDDVCEKMEETRREALREMDEAKEKKGGRSMRGQYSERVGSSWVRALRGRSLRGLAREREAKSLKE